MDPRWLIWAKELQAIAQTGLTYAGDPYDLDRYRQLREVALAIMAEGSGAELVRIRALFETETGYPTPKVDVRGAVFDGDRILMVRESSDGRWTLPGGWADVNQTPAECVEREILEESGFVARAARLVAVWDRVRQGHVPPLPFHVYKMFFLCTLEGGVATTSLETLEVGFFAADALPELSQGRVNAAQIRRMFEHRRDPSLPTDFD
jgi:ADP-ribose pyrophosphatase YjhB (NUDIX family)